MAKEKFCIGENEKLTFAVEEKWVKEIVMNVDLFKIPFSKRCIGGFFIRNGVLIPSYLSEEDGFSYYNDVFVVLNYEGQYLSLPIKSIKEICVDEPSDLEEEGVFSFCKKEVYYKGLFQVPVLDVEALYKGIGFI